jgi:hypothetical protein
MSKEAGALERQSLEMDIKRLANEIFFKNIVPRH